LNSVPIELAGERFENVHFSSHIDSQGHKTMPDDDFDIYGDEGYDLPGAQEPVCTGILKPSSLPREFTNHMSWIMQEPVQAMDNLPVDPSIGDKRPRGADEQDEELGNNIPPNLRGNVNNGMNQGLPQRQGMAMQPQQWQAPPGNQMIAGAMNMVAANNSLDALYVGELNWVSSLV
jgi:hypothetical protein